MVYGLGFVLSKFRHLDLYTFKWSLLGPLILKEKFSKQIQNILITKVFANQPR
jgi:hypothetical protein